MSSNLKTLHEIEPQRLTRRGDVLSRTEGLLRGRAPRGTLYEPRLRRSWSYRLKMQDIP